MSKPRTLLELWDRGADVQRGVIERFAAAHDVDPLLAEARAEFEGLVPEIPYADRRDHVMFGSAFGVYCSLAVWKAARARGHDVHEVGRAVIETPFPARPLAPVEALGKFREDAEASQRNAAANEFVFELIDGDGPELDWGMNILSCAVCHAYAKHDAMELVPYMCATDDVVSDSGDQGLRRTGTIALGAHQCDFRFKSGGKGQPLAPQYPDRIRVDSKSD